MLVFIAIFLLLVLALQIPFVQNFAKDKAVVYLEGKIKTKVKVGSIEPTTIHDENGNVLEDLKTAYPIKKVVANAKN